ncbi:hypothetical protein BGZ63DRAFT_236828 [Mariannaea sp. PMI_226]|nr:hypothetical protein BGZ63DRAFT_236828 [Mariannaea sp. PMI_226]
MNETYGLPTASVLAQRIRYLITAYPLFCFPSSLCNGLIRHIRKQYHSEVLNHTTTDVVCLSYYVMCTWYPALGCLFVFSDTISQVYRPGKKIQEVQVERNPRHARATSTSHPPGNKMPYIRYKMHEVKPCITPNDKEQPSLGMLHPGNANSVCLEGVSPENEENKKK